MIILSDHGVKLKVNGKLEMYMSYKKNENHFIWKWSLVYANETKRAGLLSKIRFVRGGYIEGRVLANGPGEWGLISGRHTKDSKNGTWYLLA